MITSLSDTVMLAGGISIPAIGLGTYKSSPQDVGPAVIDAVEAGYRHIDTAKVYRNEEAVGAAIKACGIPREQLFLVTKLWLDEFDRPATGFYASMKRLDAEYIDLYMLHWPGTDEKRMLTAYEGLLNLREKGDLRAAGVSNFEIPHLEKIKQEFGAYPCYNQIELHPWFARTELCDFCRANNIAVMSWGPMLHGHLSEEPLLDELAADYDRTPAQIVLRWHLQKGNLIIPKSTHRVRIIENAQLFDFVLSDEDMARIDALDKNQGFGSDPFTYNGE